MFPHVHLSAAGRLAAAVARAVVESGRDEVLALGVLHGAREQDRELVRLAREGDSGARALLRRVHGPGAPRDDGRASEEFSLEAFLQLLEVAARACGRRVPRVHARFPFLTGDRPRDLPGLDELRAIVARGAAVVATADPIHHGAGYGTPEGERLPASAGTRERARASIERGLGLLAERRFAEFLAHGERDRSDFRDAGPALVEALGEAPLRARVLDVVLADYSETLGAERPTWVAGALSAIEGEPSA